MTDYQKTKKLLDEMEIGYIEDQQLTRKGDQTELILRLEAERSKNVIGYGGFIAEFLFDEEGKSKGIGIWE